MRMTGLGIAGRSAPAASVLALAATLLLTACGSDTPPPLAGNLVDARGGHAGAFLPANAASAVPDDAESTANSQGVPQ